MRIRIRDRIPQGPWVSRKKLGDIHELVFKTQADADAYTNQLQARIDVLSGISFEQVDNYINNNVTDLASAKTFLKKLSKIVLLLSKEVEIID